MVLFAQICHRLNVCFIFISVDVAVQGEMRFLSGIAPVRSRLFSLHVKWIIYFHGGEMFPLFVVQPLAPGSELRSNKVRMIDHCSPFF